MRSALKELPGVVSVDEVTADSATCTVKPVEFNADDAIAAIKEAGFPATVKE